MFHFQSKFAHNDIIAASQPFRTAIHKTLPETPFRCMRLSTSLISCSLAPGAVSSLILFTLTLLLHVANIQPSMSKPITSYSELKPPTEQVSHLAAVVQCLSFAYAEISRVPVKRNYVLLDLNTSKYYTYPTY